MNHSHSQHQGRFIQHHSNQERHQPMKLAVSATIHCLIGCGIGEVTGMMLGTHFGLNNLSTIIISIFLAFAGGILIGLMPLIRNGFSLSKAFRTVIIGEGLSIVVMIAVEVIVETSIPGVMDAHLSDWLFWAGMAAGLSAGFVAALPVNYFMIKKGLGHTH
jgi:hypothetical protein